MTFAAAANVVTGIQRALNQGYPYYLIINNLIKNDKVLGPKIKEALNQGYTEDQIGEYLSKGKNMPFGQRQSLLSGMTEKEKQDKIFYRQPKDERAALKAIPMVAAGLAGYGLARAMPTPAVRPNQILPAQRAQQGPRQLPPPQPTINVTPRGPQRPGGSPALLPAPQNARGLPTPGPRSPGGSPMPNQPTTPMPQAQVQTPQATPSPQTSGLQILQNVGIATTLQNLVKNNPDISPQEMAGILQSVEPKKTKALTQDRSVNFPQLVESAMQELQGMPPQESPLARNQSLQQQPQEIQAQSEQMPMEQPIEQMPEMQSEPRRQGKIQAAVMESKPLRKLSEATLKGKSFAVPTYRFEGESEKDFSNRQVINSAIEKASKALEEGKTFLDFPEPWGKIETTEKTISRGPRKGVVERETKVTDRFARSTAVDVLRYLAGVPNVFDPLLDDEEKQEINDSLDEAGIKHAKAAVPGGDANVYGAQMTPNLVWNLLLSVEPKLQEFEKPQSVKGYPKLPQGKMGTTELRRFLTHAVYGALSGKTVTTKLADKINKISRAAMSMDILAEASKQGKLNAVIEEQERLLKDDEYFFSLFNEETEQKARGLR